MEEHPTVDPIDREFDRITRGVLRENGASALLDVLLMEADPNDALLLTRSLVASGFRVKVVPSLREARQRLREEPADLILAAEKVSDGTAATLAAERNTPLVVLADTFDKDAVRRAYAAGAAEVFVKDASLLPLLDLRVERLLRAEAEHRLVAHLNAENESLLKQNRVLLELAVKDPLTGILNRRGFEEALRREQSRAARTRQELALTFFDLDRFKDVNDQFGHEAGDKLLRGFGQILEGKGRPTDTVARIGGDEFVALLPSTPLEGAHVFAERVRSAAETTYVAYGDLELRTTVSAGAALFSESHASGRDLLTLADERLYRAKSEGRNRTVS